MVPERPVRTMMQGVPAQSDDPSDEVWQEVESALDELAQLSADQISASEFHGKLLERCVGLLAATGGLIWERAPSGSLSVVAQLHPDRSFAGNADELARHQRIAATVLAAGEPRLIPPAYRDGQLANATPWLLVVCPISVEDRPTLVIELFQRPDGRASVERGYLRLVRIACDLAEQFHRSRLLHQLRHREQELTGLLQLLEQAHRPVPLQETAANVANESRRWLSCDRVAVLVCRQPERPEVLAVSGSESFDRRSEIVRAWEKLSRYVAVSGATLWHPDAEPLATELADDVHAALEQSHARGMGLLPIVSDPESDARPIGVLIVEAFGREFDQATRERAELTAKAVGTPLHKALEVDRIPLRSVLQPLGRGWQALRSRFAVQAGAVLATIIAIVAALWLIPTELTVEARGQILPQERQNVFAPEDGVVVELLKDNGEQVAAGELLARLHSPALDIQLSELVGRQRTAQENLQAAETELLQHEQSSGSTAALDRAQLAARIETLKEERRGLESQLAIVRSQQTALEVRSPIQGLVITWDASRQLAGRPVNRGDRLLTIANISGPWELVLDVPDRRAGDVARAQSQSKTPLPVRYQIGTNASTVRTATVEQVSPATQLDDSGQPVLRLVAIPERQAYATERPGATVIARIQCGRASLGYVWLRDLWDTVRSWLVL